MNPNESQLVGPILEQNQDLSFKTADQEREVRTYESEQNKLAAVAEIQNEEEVGRRAIGKEKAIQVEGVTKEQAIAKANSASTHDVSTRISLRFVDVVCRRARLRRPVVRVARVAGVGDGVRRHAAAAPRAVGCCVYSLGVDLVYTVESDAYLC